MLTTISDEMSVNRLVRPRNQTFRLIVNVLSPDDQRRRGFSLQTIGYMQREAGYHGRSSRSGSWFWVLGSGSGSGSVPEPEPERNPNSEPRTLNREHWIAIRYSLTRLSRVIVTETDESFACRIQVMRGRILGPITVTLVPSCPRSSQYSIGSSIVFALRMVPRTVSESRSNCPETTPAANTRISNKPRPTVFILRLLGS